MECFENGLLSLKDTNGIELRFGNDEAMLKVIELIARREGIGDLLAEGTIRAAQRIGKGAEEFAVQVKGLGPGLHEPRLKPGLGLGFMVNPHGADHCANLHDTGYTAVSPGLMALNLLGILEPLPATDLGPKKVNMFRYVHSFSIMRDCAVLCIFPPYNIEMFTDIVKTVTGWNTGVVELLKVVDRTLTLARMFNLREGLTAADDSLPKRLFEQHVGGPSANNQPYEADKLETAKSYYYTLMGWDAKTGVPTPETLDVLDISWAASK